MAIASTFCICSFLKFRSPLISTLRQNLGANRPESLFVHLSVAGVLQSVYADALSAFAVAQGHACESVEPRREVVEHAVVRRSKNLGCIISPSVWHPAAIGLPLRFRCCFLPSPLPATSTQGRTRRCSICRCRMWRLSSLRRLR